MPKFRTVQIPNIGVANYDQRVQQSIVNEFNRVQTMGQRGTTSNYSAKVWLKQERLKCAIYPHKLDYYDFCIKKNLIQAKQTTLNRIRQTGSANESQQTQIAALKDELKTHRKRAQK